MKGNTESLLLPWGSQTVGMGISYHEEWNEEAGLLLGSNQDSDTESRHLGQQSMHTSPNFSIFSGLVPSNPETPHLVTYFLYHNLLVNGNKTAINERDRSR